MPSEDDPEVPSCSILRPLTSACPASETGSSSRPFSCTVLPWASRFHARIGASSTVLSLMVVESGWTISVACFDDFIVFVMVC